MKKWKKRGGKDEMHSLKELWEAEPGLAQEYAVRLGASAACLALGTAACTFLGIPQASLFVLAACAAFAASMGWRIRSILKGDVSIYKGEAVRVARAGMSRSGGARLRPSVILRNEAGMYITFHPAGRMPVCKEGDAVTVYAPSWAFSQTGADSCELSMYYHAHVDRYAPATPGA